MALGIMAIHPAGNYKLSICMVILFPSCTCRSSVFSTIHYPLPQDKVPLQMATKGKLVRLKNEVGFYLHAVAHK
jgi:hypothetical protein